MKTQNILVALAMVGATNGGPSMTAELCNAEVEETDSTNARVSASLECNRSKAAWYAQIYRAINPKISLLANATVSNDAQRDNKIAIKTASKRRILEATVLKSSGDSDFDVICLAAVKSLEGNSVLDFPKSTQGVIPSVVLSFSFGPNSPNSPSKDFSRSEIESLMKLDIPVIKKQLNATVEVTSKGKISAE